MSNTKNVIPLAARANPSTALWAHLLRRDVSMLPAENSQQQLASIVPVDKTSTSLRVLLHDTQANLEKFSDRIDKLTDGVQHAKREIVLVKTMFETEHEKVREEMVQIVNRCQREIQKVVDGNTHKLDELKTENDAANQRIDALNKRIDDIHSLNQTHSQILSTQTQALQTIQEQQTAILATIIPLLPLLQAVPLHIESAQNHIKNALFDAARTMSPPNRSQLFGHAMNGINSSGKRVGSMQRQGPASSSISSRKRQKLELPVDRDHVHYSVPVNLPFQTRGSVQPQLKTPLRKPLAEMQLGNILSSSPVNPTNHFHNTPQADNSSSSAVAIERPRTSLLRNHRSSLASISPNLPRPAVPLSTISNISAAAEQDNSVPAAFTTPMLPLPADRNFGVVRSGGMPFGKTGGNMRQRPVRTEGKRFIPLDDDEDDDDFEQDISGVRV